VSVGQAVTLDGSGSSDDRQAPEDLTYAWDTDGNGSDDASGQVVTHTYTRAPVEVRLGVTDGDGASDTATTVVTVKAAPPDLQVTAMTTSNPKPKQGDKVTVVVTVKNTGAGRPPPRARSSRTAMWQSTPSTRRRSPRAQPSSSGFAPDGWSGQSTSAGQATWSEGGSDGSKSASTTGSGGSAALPGAPMWTSDPIAVTPGEALDLSVAVRLFGADRRPRVAGRRRQLVRTVTALTAPLSTTGFQDLATTVTVPAGVTQVRIVLSGFSLLDPATRGTVSFDDVRLFSH